MRVFVMTSVFILLMMVVSPFAEPQQATKVDRLIELSKEFARNLESRRTPLYYELLKSTSPAQMKLNESEEIELMYIDDNGHPVFFATDNLNAAKTTNTDKVWPGASFGFSLDGRVGLLSLIQAQRLTTDPRQGNAGTGANDACLDYWGRLHHLKT